MVIPPASQEAESAHARCGDGEKGCLHGAMRSNYYQMDVVCFF